MKKLLILSGKGGTGKTTTAAAFINFSKTMASADCDVDAPNLHIVSRLESEPEKKRFFGSDKAVINPDKCSGCGECHRKCRFNAIKPAGGVFKVDEFACEGCGVCQYVCGFDAAKLEPDIAGNLELYKNGRVFSTARLKMGRGNSGKLVTEVKKQLDENYKGDDVAIIDGSPGIGCPVIASVNGVDMVLIVAEPSQSGISDLKRIVKTTELLQAKSLVCVNKWDSSPEKTEEIERFCVENNVEYVGRIPYDKMASKAANEGRSVAEIDCRAGEALFEVYKKVMDKLMA